MKSCPEFERMLDRFRHRSSSQILGSLLVMKYRNCVFSNRGIDDPSPPRLEVESMDLIAGSLLEFSKAKTRCLPHNQHSEAPGSTVEADDQASRRLNCNSATCLSARSLRDEDDYR